MSEAAKTKKANRTNVLPVKLSDTEEAEVRSEAELAGLTPVQLARHAPLLYARELRKTRATPEPTRRAS